MKPSMSIASCKTSTSASAARRMMEQKRTSELLSDFDDYDVGDRPRPRKGQ
jgi:hypothetical protein